MQTALKTAAEDQQQIATLRQEIDAKQRLVEEANRKEEQAKETISKRKAEIEELVSRPFRSRIRCVRSGVRWLFVGVCHGFGAETWRFLEAEGVRDGQDRSRPRHVGGARVSAPRLLPRFSM